MIMDPYSRGDSMTEDINPDLFDEDFEDAFEDFDLDEEDLEDLEDLLAEDCDCDEEGCICQASRQHKHLWPPAIKRGAILFIYSLSDLHVQP